MPTPPPSARSQSARSQSARSEFARSGPGSPLGVFVGLATLDVIHHAATRPGPDQKVTATKQFVAAGGPAANAAVTFAALGGRARLVTVLGPGPIGALVRAELAGWSVEVFDVDPDGDREPPVAAILVDPAAGSRSVVSPDTTGSTATFDSPELLAGADVVLVDGHHRHLAIAAAEAAARAGTDLIVDAGRWKPVFTELIPHATAMLCSADFRLPHHAADEQDRSARELVDRGVPVVATTHGPAPVRWWIGASSGVIEVPPVRAVDTLGAGDAFHGAYAWASCSGDPIRNRIEEPLAWLSFAMGVAGLKVSTAGPRGWLTKL